MNLGTQRLIDSWVGRPLCALVSLWAWLRGRGGTYQPGHAAVRNVLVIMLSEMGSVVLAGPMFARIRQLHPGAAIHVLQLAKNREVSLLLGITDAQRLHTIDDKSLWRLCSSLLRVIRLLRKSSIDAVIDCELFSRISALVAYASGAELRAGFTRHTQEGLYRGSFFNRALPYNPYRHISLQFIAMVDALQATGVPRSRDSLVTRLPTQPGLDPSIESSEMDAFGVRLRRDYPEAVGRRWVLLYPGGGILPERAWPAAHYVELARALVASGHVVAVIGLREDKRLAREILAAVDSERCLDLTGYTRDVRELLLLFHHADLLVTNDGGPGHFASLTPIRTIMLFGPETSRLYGPLSPRATAIDLQIACSPCLTAYNHRRTFCDGDNQCLKRIGPADIIARAHAALGDSR